MGYTAAVITVSDKGARGERVDTSGPRLVSMLKEHGYDVRYTAIIPDEREQIKAELVKCADELRISLVLTTGGTGFSSRDITPEATLEIVERRTPGIPEAMRSESLKITPRGCLSRAEAGIRGWTLIINLPGSEKAAKENLEAVLEPIAHGVQMLLGSGSGDCGEPIGYEHHHHHGKKSPSMDEWLREAKKDPSAKRIGMYLTHNGIVRATARALAREGDTSAAPVSGMAFSYDRERVEAAIADTYKLEGVYNVRVWLNEGELSVGDDIMYILIGGDIRPHTVDALQYLVGRIKTECVTETETF